MEERGLSGAVSMQTDVIFAHDSDVKVILGDIVDGKYWLVVEIVCARDLSPHATTLASPKHHILFLTRITRTDT